MLMMQTLGSISIMCGKNRWYNLQRAEEEHADQLDAMLLGDFERPEPRDRKAEDGQVGDDVEDGASDQDGAELDAVDFDRRFPEEGEWDALHY